MASSKGSPGGRHLGTLEVLDHKPRRVDVQQILLPAGMDASIAQLWNQRVSALSISMVSTGSVDDCGTDVCQLPRLVYEDICILADS